MHVAISRILLGFGEVLFGGIDLLKLGYQVSEQVALRPQSISESANETAHYPDRRPAQSAAVDWKHGAY